MNQQTRMSRADPSVVATVASHGIRLSWGAVWSGFLVTVGMILLLSVLGLAVGVTAVDLSPEMAGNAQQIGIGAAVWSGLSLLIALFVGGMAASRSGMMADAVAGAINGFLIWVLMLLSFIALASSGFGSMTQAMFGALAGLVSSASSPPDAQVMLWSVLAAMVASLLAALAGAAAGRRQVMKRASAIRIHDHAPSATPLTASAGASDSRAVR
jgi:hypothetical protein